MVKKRAEGHISHIYAYLMSSRPLGWSWKGADKMSRLWIYEKNSGHMLELVRYQRKELPMAAGCEEVICSSREMFSAERKKSPRGIGRRVSIQHTIHADKENGSIEESYLGLVKREKSDIVKIVNQFGTHLR